MTGPLDGIESSIVRLDPNDLIYQRGIKEYHNYEFKYQAPFIKLRKKIDPTKIYTAELSYDNTETLGKCSCPSYLTGKQRPCKHVFIVLLNYLGRLLEEQPLKLWNEAMKCLILDDYEALDGAPGINIDLLNETYRTLDKEVRQTTPPTPATSDDWKPLPAVEQERRFRESVKNLPQVQANKAPLKASAAFGGQIENIPKNLVITLHGKPYVTKAGLVYAASQKGLQSIITKACSWSWENDDGRAVFEATVTFKDGRSFTAHGVAIPDKKNVTNTKMFAFIDHLAETRAIGRALRNAIAFGEPTIEEMPDYDGEFE